jgi:hypothetical protein
VTADTIDRTMGGNEIILRVHQSVSHPSTATTLFPEVQLRQAGHVVYSVHKDHWISIDGSKGTQSLNLRQPDQEEGELMYIIPFVRRANQMTFDHRKPDILDFERNLPIVMFTMDIKWDPPNHHDDHAKVVSDKLEANLNAGHSEISLQEHIASSQFVRVESWRDMFGVCFAWRGGGHLP